MRCSASNPRANILTVRNVVGLLRVELVLSFMIISKLGIVAELISRLLVNWLIVLINADELIFYVLVVGHISVLESLDIVKDVFDFLNVFGLVPKKSFWRFKTPSLDILDLIHSIFFNFSPHQFFFQKVKYYEIKAPEIISSRQVNVIMSIQTGKTDRSSEICL